MSNPIQTLKRNSLSLSIATALGGLALVSTGAQAAAPAAGTNISNIATATYSDGSTTRTVTSNEVKTTVTQVGSFRLVQDVTTSANQNSEVQLQHTLYNDGNGTDTFTINLVNNNSGSIVLDKDGNAVGSDNWDFSNIKVFLDTDGDGKADSNTPLTTSSVVTVAAGGKVNLIVVATTAGGVSSGSFGQLGLSATSKVVSGDTNASALDKTKYNVDKVNITAGAVFSVEKKASVNEVNVKTASQTILYTLSYRNKGNDKGDLIIDDTLNANLAFRPTGTNDANFADHVVKLNGSVLAYVKTPTGSETASYYTYDSVTKKLRFVIKNVERNTDGNITFESDVKAGTAPGTVPNTAMYDSDGPDPSGNIVPDVPTNNTEIKVASTNTGVINDAVTKTDKTGNDDTITAASVAQGSSVKFGSGTENTGLEVIYVHNNGDTTDTFTVELDALSNLPVGTTVTFLQPNGTPLTSTVGNAKDTGPIAVGGSYQLIAVVNLPPEFSGKQVNGKDIQAVVKITSTKDASQTDPITLKISEVTKNSVDLSNGKGNKDGKDDAGEKTGEGQNTSYTVDKLTANPGQTITFPIAVTNHGSSTDNYNLTTDLPSDWKVEFFTADSTGTCTGTAPISNTGDVEPGAAQTQYFCAKVTPPTNAPAGDKDITFTVSSVATKLSDTMKDQVVVNAVRNLTLVTGQESSVAPGGTVTYEHTLTNLGNVTEGSVAGTLYLDITQDDASTGFTTTVYVDTNGDGVLDSADAVLTAAKNDLGAALAGLAQNESVKLWVKVQAPSTATNGLVDVSTIKVYADGKISTIDPAAAVSNKDRTTVTAGQVRLEKTQALDAKCDGTSVGTFGTATLAAKPGECVVYQIKAINDGKAEVTNVQITDAVPAYTTGTSPTTATNISFVPASTETPAPTYTLNGKQLSVSPFKLQPNQNATLQFTVEVDK